MLKKACLSFQREFEPGQPEGHEASCDSCRAWAREVVALRGLGVDLTLPSALRGRLGAHAWQDEESGSPTPHEPLPQITVPSDVLARLKRIPSESRLAQAVRPVATRSGEMVAASLLFAALLTFGVRSSLPPTHHQALAATSRIAGAVLEEAGNRGTQALLGVGRGILDGCLNATDSLDRLLDRIDQPRREPAPNTRTPGASPTPSEKRKEPCYGSR